MHTLGRTRAQKFRPAARKNARALGWPLNWATSRSKRCTFSAQVREAYAIADRLRRAGVRVAMGLHVSVRPEEAALHADYLVRGEGTLFDVNYVLKKMSVEELRGGIRWLTERLYGDRQHDSAAIRAVTVYNPRPAVGSLA